MKSGNTRDALSCFHVAIAVLLFRFDTSLFVDCLVASPDPVPDPVPDPAIDPVTNPVTDTVIDPVPDPVIDPVPDFMPY